MLFVIGEFNANTEERERDQVLVRGKMVPFSRKSIKEFFMLNDIETLGYAYIISEGFDAYHILNTITTPNT